MVELISRFVMSTRPVQASVRMSIILRAINIMTVASIQAGTEL